MLEQTLKTGQRVHFDLYKHQNPVVNDAYERLVTGIHLQKKKNNFNLFTITSCEPDVGTTTIAISLAISLATAGRKTLLVDTDMRKGANYKRLNQEIELGLSEHLAENASLEAILCETNFLNLKYISSGKKPDSPSDIFLSQKFDDFLDTVKAAYDYVIFDSPSLNAAVDGGIVASKTSAVLLVARQYKTKKSQVKAAKRELKNVGANLLGIVINHVDQKEYKRYLKSYDYFR